MRRVRVEWRRFAPDDWVESAWRGTAPEAPEWATSVVVGRAVDEDGCVLADVVAPARAGEDVHALIERELSPHLDAILDALVGPLAWKRVAS